MKNKIQDGAVLDYTASGAAIASGDVVLMGVRIGIAVAAIADGSTGSVETEGVFEIAKKSTDTFVQGAACYWDNSAKNITSTSSGTTLAGYASEAAGNGATLIRVKINA